MNAGSEKGDHAPDNSRQQLAHELVDCLGREGAIHVCKVNGWQGILDLLETEAETDPGAPANH